jgi:drug/metabolite transporter (DMT)-like permease
VSRWNVRLAYAAICLIWGSTFLAVQYAIETLPPLLMVGSRFLIAGGGLYGWSRWRGVPAPAPRHWKYAAAVGTLILVMGSGLVAWGQQRVPSGLAALILAAEPLWFVVLQWWGGAKPSVGVGAGMAAGFLGVGLLVAPDKALGASVDLIGAGVLSVAAFGWAAGGLYSRTAPQPDSHLMANAMQMLTGGAILVLGGLLTGEWARVTPHMFAARSLAAFFYLLVFSSLVAYTVYLWLLKEIPPTRAATSSYVIPVIAVLLGWLVAGETLTPRMWIAAAIIVASVVVVISRESHT